MNIIKIIYSQIFLIILLNYSFVFADNSSICVYYEKLCNSKTSLKYINNKVKKIIINVTSGDNYSTSFYIKSNNYYSDINLKSSGLKNTKNNLVYHNAIDIRYVKDWYQATGNWSSVQKKSNMPVLIPELLIKNDSFIKNDKNEEKSYVKTSDGYVETSKLENKISKGVTISDDNCLSEMTIEPGETRQIWLTISLPKDALPGEYAGSVEIISKLNSVNISVPIIVIVEPYYLKDPLIEYSIYYRGVLVDNLENYVGSEKKSTKQMSAEFDNMVKHGVVNPTIKQNLNKYDLFKKVLDLRISSGISNNKLYLLSITTDAYNNKATTSWRKQLVLDMIMKEYIFGVKDVYVYGIDEANTENIIKQYEIWDDYKKSGIKIFAASYQAEKEKYLAGMVNLIINGAPFSQDVNNYYKERNTKVYLYNQPQVGKEDYLTYRKNYGLRAWQCNADGVMNYAYQHSMNFIWDDFDHESYRDHVFAYPTSNGVIDTIQWEGFMEGVTDMKYLSTLVYLAEANDDYAQLSYIRDLKEKKDFNPAMIRKELADRITTLCGQYQNKEKNICRN